jgi:hypothetical protein
LRITLRSPVPFVSIQDHEEFASRWARMWTSRHLEPLLSLFAPQAVYTNAQLHIRAQGLSELRRHFGRILHVDFKVTAGPAVWHDGGVVLEWTAPLLRKSGPDVRFGQGCAPRMTPRQNGARATAVVRSAADGLVRALSGGGPPRVRRPQTELGAKKIAEMG